MSRHPIRLERTKSTVPARPGSARPDGGGERGIALVVVLLLLATTTVIGIGAMSQAISDMKIAANENCSDRVLNAAEVGIEDGMATVFALSDQGEFYNSNPNYNLEPLTYYNIVKNSAGQGNCGDQSAGASDAVNGCASALSGADPDGVLQAANEGEGGQYDYFYEVRLVNPNIAQREGIACDRAAMGEQIGEGGIQCRDYVIHSVGRGCGTTQDMYERVMKSIRGQGGQAYSY